MSDRVVVEVGAAAPDFTLKDQNEHEHRLSDLRGKQVVLSFHPLAWTRICTIQMQDLEKHKADLDGLGAVALGISVDSHACKKAWGQAIGVTETALLADFWPHGGVASLYGVFFDDFGFSMRAVFIVNEQGVVTFKKVYPTKQVPDVLEILENLEEDSA
jgi:peroxiredoxin